MARQSAAMQEVTDYLLRRNRERYYHRVPVQHADRLSDRDRGAFQRSRRVPAALAAARRRTDDATRRPG